MWDIVLAGQNGGHPLGSRDQGLGLWLDCRTECGEGNAHDVQVWSSKTCRGVNVSNEQKHLVGRYMFETCGTAARG